jgi:hypothetical protein
MSKQPNWWKYAYTTEPDIELLEQLLNDDASDFYSSYQVQAIQLKYKAMMAEPTIIEKQCHQNSYLMRKIHFGHDITPFKNYIITLNIAKNSTITNKWMPSFEKVKKSVRQLKNIIVRKELK